MFLIVFWDYREKAVFTNAMELPEVGYVKTYDEGNVMLEQYEAYMCLVTKDIKVVEQVIKEEGGKIESVICIKRLLKNDWFCVKNAEELESCLLTRFTTSCKSKLGFGLFQQSPTHSKEEVKEVKTKEKKVILKRTRASGCVSCLVDKTAVLFDCGHQCLCESCFELWNETCPVCRSKPKKMYITEK